MSDATERSWERAQDAQHERDLDVDDQINAAADADMSRAIAMAVELEAHTGWAWDPDSSGDLSGGGHWISLGAMRVDAAPGPSGPGYYATATVSGMTADGMGDSAAAAYDAMMIDVARLLAESEGEIR